MDTRDMACAVTVEGEQLALDRGQTLAHIRTLDLRRGVLISEWRQRDGAGRIIRLRTLRFVSLANRALAVQVAWIEVAQPTALTLEASLAPADDGLLPKLRRPDLTLWRTAQRERQLAVASAATLCVGGTTVRWEAISHGTRRCSWIGLPDQPASFARIIAVARGDATADPSGPAQATLRCVPLAGWPPLLAAHERVWADRWAETDVAVEGDDLAQQALRFASYHLISAANQDDAHTSIGARALTGEADLGHVFWDTDLFLLPFYIFTWPAAARALLMYRYHTLPAARAKAARLGYVGALYAWESADTGDEATPPYAVGPDGQVVAIRCGSDEQHISADVAYAVWQYWQATEDRAFLLTAGAEIILETARFWASRATREADGQYHIRHVIGPDEYHEGVDDNVYTNGMAQWNLERGLEVAQLVQERWPLWWARLGERIGLTPAERDRWRDVAAHLVIGLDRQRGLFEQFAGFFDLEPVDLAAYEPRSGPMDVLLGRERTQRSQVSKQADMLMLLALLWKRYPPEIRAANFRYYESRCGHGSSLSPPIHALVAARLGEVELAERYFRQDGGDRSGRCRRQHGSGRAYRRAWRLMAGRGHWVRRAQFPGGWAELRPAPAAPLARVALPDPLARARGPDRAGAGAANPHGDTRAWGTTRGTPGPMQRHRPGRAQLDELPGRARSAVEGGNKMSIYTPTQHTKVLVALDGSPAAATALPMARAIAAELDAAITILYSATVPVPAADLRRRLGLDQVGEEVLQVQAPSGASAAGILRASAAPEVVLLVLTTHGRSISDGPRLGRVAEAVVAGSVRPLLLVPPETVPAPSAGRPVLQRLLLPLDGTPTTATALRPATALASRLGASVDLLYVAEPGQALPTEPGSIAAPRYVDQPQHEWPHWANEVIARLCTSSAACPPDVPVRMFLAHGPIGTAIAQFAADQQEDVIVLVRRSRLERGRARVLRAVLHQTRCPVLLLSGPPG